ncbi:MAG: hypothetical protein WC212_00335 [Candidatus Delongbacteria bacterium]
MEIVRFKHLLFKIAFCTMACDGHVDAREVELMRYLDKNTSYFNDIDLSKELELMIDEVKKDGKRLIHNVFESFRAGELDIIQELIVLEVVLRLIHADEKIENNEKDFVQLIRSKLLVPNQIIIDRFGAVELLGLTEYVTEIKPDLSISYFEDLFEMPELKEIQNIDFGNINVNEKE